MDPECPEDCSDPCQAAGVSGSYSQFSTGQGVFATGEPLEASISDLSADVAQVILPSLLLADSGLDGVYFQSGPI